MHILSILDNERNLGIQASLIVQHIQSIRLFSRQFLVAFSIIQIAIASTVHAYNRNLNSGRLAIRICYHWPFTLANRRRQIIGRFFFQIKAVDLQQLVHIACPLLPTILLIGDSQRCIFELF